MDRDPLFSIVTVVRDDAEGLRRTRDSVRMQRCRDLEWLVADGGSGDGTAELLAGWAAETAWRRSGPDGGPFDGMNRAMVHARGRYLVFLNGGDSFAGPEVLERLAAALRAAGWPGLAFGDTVEDPGDGRPRLRPARSAAWAWYGMFAHHCAMAYEKSSIGGLTYPTGYRIAADYAFTLAVLARRPRLLRLGWPVARFAPGGLSRRHAALGREEQDRIRGDLLGIAPPLRRAITAVQAGTALLRRTQPSLYAALRFVATGSDA